MNTNTLTPPGFRGLPVRRLGTLAFAALAATVMATPVWAQVTATLAGPAMLPEGGLVAVKYGKCLQPGDIPLFTPGNRYCESFNVTLLTRCLRIRAWPCDVRRRVTVSGILPRVFWFPAWAAFSMG